MSLVNSTFTKLNQVNSSTSSSFCVFSGTGVSNPDNYFISWECYNFFVALCVGRELKFVSCREEQSFIERERQRSYEWWVFAS